MCLIRKDTSSASCNNFSNKFPLIHNCVKCVSNINSMSAGGTSHSARDIKNWFSSSTSIINSTRFTPQGTSWQLNYRLDTRKKTEQFYDSTSIFMTLHIWSERKQQHRQQFKTIKNLDNVSSRLASPSTAILRHHKNMNSLKHRCLLHIYKEVFVTMWELGHEDKMYLKTSHVCEINSNKISSSWMNLYVCVMQLHHLLSHFSPSPVPWKGSFICFISRDASPRALKPWIRLKTMLSKRNRHHLFAYTRHG